MGTNDSSHSISVVSSAEVSQYDRVSNVSGSSASVVSPTFESLLRFDEYLIDLPHAVRTTLLAKLRQTSQKSYKGYFVDFIKFCEGKDLQSSDLSTATILEYLQDAVSRNLSFSAVKLRLCALRFYFYRSSLKAIVENPLLDDFLAGAKNLAPPPKKQMHIWNAQKPLAWIASQLRPSTFVPAVTEALVLLLLATGLRLDDALKLGADVMRESDELGNLTLLRIPFLQLRKCRINGKETDHVPLPVFQRLPRLCPVAALENYLRVASAFRCQDATELFISSSGSKVAPATARKWVVELLFRAGIRASAGSLRSAATSFAAFSGISVEAILKSAGWSSENTFRTFYSRPITECDVPLFANVDLPFAVAENEEEDVI